MDFDPFGSLTDDKDAQQITSNWNLLSNEDANATSGEPMMTRTEEDAGQVNENTFSPFTAEGVDVDNGVADDQIFQQEEKFETSTDKIETTVWAADNEKPLTSSQVKVRQVMIIRGG